MRKFTVLAIVAIAWTASLLDIDWGISECTAATQNVAGKWLGTLKSMRVAFEITEASESNYTAVVHSIDQGAMNIALTAVTVNDDSLRLELKSVFVYEGILRMDGCGFGYSFLDRAGRLDDVVPMLADAESMPRAGPLSAVSLKPFDQGEKK
ncbi:MAG: hypothetical protein H8D56_04605 [Planctomycetes bacterium]|nr:hypothetical protein [Planctomycetota bacterium]MBL7143820.1 hypothetical protein [Phycisphaerae bacterium]